MNCEMICYRKENTPIRLSSLYGDLCRFHHGDVLATVATGELSDTVADNAGLVTTHAYAVLDIRFG